MIKVLVASVVGLVIGIAVMVIVIVAKGTTTSGASSVGLSLSVSTATLPSSSTTAPPASSSSSGTSGGASAGDADAGKTVFIGSAGCGGCHTFTAAGTSGMVGPNLDNVSADETASGSASLTDFLHESIVDPDAYIAKGYSKGIMPTDFGTSLSSTDIANLVAFLSQNQTS